MNKLTNLRLPGIMNSYSTACETIGMLVIFILNTIIPWREIALYCLTVPVLSFVMLSFVSIKLV